MIEITNVSKRFGDVLALNDVSMSIRETFTEIGTQKPNCFFQSRILSPASLQT